jgi:hypothetical protein
LFTKETVEPRSKKDDSEAHNEKLVMGNHNLKAQVEKLSQQVEDLQLCGSETSATKKKRVRFSDDSVSPVQLLRDAVPSISASNLANLGQKLLELESHILRELLKRPPSDQASSASPSGGFHTLSQTTGKTRITNPASPIPPHTPKT